MRSFLHGLLLAFVLLLTQQGAMLHELGHATGTVSTSSDTDHDHGMAGLCVACLAFSQAATGAAPAPVAHHLVAGLSFATAAAPRVPAATAHAPPPRSRGPPTFL